MRYSTFFLFIFLISFSTDLQANRIKAALKQLEKGEYEKARELAEKDLEKDSLSAGAYYIFSLYFSHPQNPYYYVDSAYIFILDAIAYFPQVEEKLVEDWNKVQVNDSSFQAQKVVVETLAYEWALKVDKIEEYQHFIDFYPTASQVFKAIQNRDELAWQEAKSKNTLQAFQAFMDDYPSAKQISQAKNKRDRFIYGRETKEKTLQAFENFIQKYPDNDFREEAEKHLFEIFTVTHSLEAYQAFIQKYPSNSFVSRAYDWALSFEIKNQTMETFLTRYPNYPNKKELESLLKFEKEPFLITYQNGKYGFIGSSGQIGLSPQFEQVLEDYQCESVENLYFIFIQNQKQGLMDKTGKILISPSFDTIEDIEDGLFKTQIGNKFGVFHWRGFEILQPKFQDIKPLAGKYWRVKKGDKWAVYSMNGRLLVKAQFDVIEILGDNFISFQKNGKYLIKQKDRLVDWLPNPNTELEMPFESVSLKTSDFVEVQSNGKKSILNTKEELILPFQIPDIHYSENAWIIPTDSLYQEVFSLSGKKIELDSIQAVSTNQNFITLKRNKAWQLYNSKGQQLTETALDSIALFQDITLFFQKRAKWASFQNDSDSVNLSKNRALKIVRGNYPNAQEFLAFKANSNRWGLLNPLGEEIIKATYYQDISILDSNLIVGKYGSLEGLLDFEGNVLLKVEYEGISQLSNGYLGLLRYRKFGLFHPEKDILIPTNYEVIPEAYSEKGAYFIAQKNKKLGLVNQKNEIVIPFEFKEIHFWQPEMALVKKENIWQFYDIQKKGLLQDVSFEALTFVKSTLEEVIIIPNQDNSKFGLWNSQVGEVLETQYDWIENINSLEKPIFLIETKSKKNQYEIQYVSATGEVIWETNLTEEAYEQLICP